MAAWKVAPLTNFASTTRRTPSPMLCAIPEYFSVLPGATGLEALAGYVTRPACNRALIKIASAVQTSAT